MIFVSLPIPRHSWMRVLLACYALSLSAAICCAEPLSLRLHATLEQLAKENGVCVVSVATVNNKVVGDVEVATGCESSETPSAQAVFQAASLGKPVFAYGVMKLVQQGKLDLDAPLTKYLPQGYLHIQNPFDNQRAPVTDLVTAPELRLVTARIVLTHTSGLRNWSGKPLEFDFQPGTDWQYSGEGYVLLQRVVEAIAGVDLDAFMRTQVFEPIGMTHSDYIWNAQWESNIVVGRLSDGTLVPPSNFHLPIAAATLYTTAQDYAKFLAAVLADAPVVSAIVDSPASVDKGLGLYWGLGWGIERSDGDRFIWHWGSNPGFRAFVMASVQSGDGVVVLTNSENGLALAEIIVNAVLPGAHKAFKSYLLRDGLGRFLCKTLGLCF